MLDQQRGGRVVGDVGQHIPGLLIAEDLHTVGGGLRAGLGPLLKALLALDAQPDQGADLAAQLDRLVQGEVAEVGYLDLALGVFVTARASITRMVSLSRSRSSSWMISPWKLGWLNPSTSSCTGPIAMRSPFACCAASVGGTGHDSPSGIVTADQAPSITR
jgi:hypothetical protein